MLPSATGTWSEREYPGESVRVLVIDFVTEFRIVSLGAMSRHIVVRRSIIVYVRK